jgi:prepilin-type N-terminal cleavage/methylation domain-containing protein
MVTYFAQKRGLTLIEVAISVVVLGVVSTTVAEVMQWSVAQHRAAERKRCALEIATSILDKFTVRDWSAITAKNAATIKLPAEATQSLVDPHLNVEVEQEKEAGKTADAAKSLLSKRVSVELSWTDGAVAKLDCVHLSTWVFERNTASASKH